MTTETHPAEPALIVDPRVRRTEWLISMLLRAGVMASLVLVAAGTAVTLIHHPDYFTSSDSLEPLRSGSLPFPTTIPAIAHGLARFQGRAIVAAGLLVLVLTPILRVGVSIAIFAFTRDRLFAAITTGVLGLLFLSLLIGKAGG